MWLKAGSFVDGATSSESFLDDVGLTFGAGEFLVEALIEISQPIVVEAHQVQYRGVQVGNVMSVFDAQEAQFIGCAETDAARPRLSGPAAGVEPAPKAPPHGATGARAAVRRLFLKRHPERRPYGRGDRHGADDTRCPMRLSTHRTDVAQS